LLKTQACSAVTSHQLPGAIGATSTCRQTLITGASRGIGRAIALRAALAISRSRPTVEPRQTTGHSSVAEIAAAGGRALPIRLDVRDADNITAAVQQCADHFGGIDICVNNASAISLTPTLSTPARKFDLIVDCNVRGTYLVSQACIPHLLESAQKGRNPHILNLSPPMSMDPGWFAHHLAYTLSKYGMSMCTLGMAAEFRKRRRRHSWRAPALPRQQWSSIFRGDSGRPYRRHHVLAHTHPHRQCLNQRQFLPRRSVLRQAASDFERYAIGPNAAGTGRVEPHSGEAT
jgi:NAD(P)-dependent dehydrogenase (short-subunit alcohol dehydrogenase family)